MCGSHSPVSREKDQQMHAEDQIDPVLATLVEVANHEKCEDETPVEIHITVVVGGATVTGVLTSNAKWFEAQPMLNSYAEGLREDAAEQNAVMSALESLEDIDPHWRRAIHAEASVGYLHLRNARFFAGPNLVPSKNGNSDGMFWRCKLTDVSGWALGSIGEDAPSATVDAAVNA